MKAAKVTDKKQLALIANSIRQDIVKMLCESKSGHPGGSLGMTDIFTALYFSIMTHDPKNPLWSDRDRFVLSNGHICPVLYATLAEAGYFPKDELMTLRKMGSRLQGHPHRGTLPGIETSSGPLGQGLSQAVGMAIVGKAENKSWRVYAALSDGEHNEGQTWEAILLAAKYKLDNLVAIIDRNKIQIDGNTENILPLEPFADKYRAFGWNVIEIDGHDFEQILKAYARANANESKGKPTVIIANTVPGKHVSFMENLFEWHGKSPSKEQTDKAIDELQVIRKQIEEGKI
ncbi:transketolase [Candidatus Micrarchaeota archaeon]|nr:transketolase [Candidatus Micrarchaeota archaeon]